MTSYFGEYDVIFFIQSNHIGTSSILKCLHGLDSLLLH